MPAPDEFSWVDKPLLAGMAPTRSMDELAWLRDQGIQLLIWLTEEPVRRDWINEAGLFAMHVPVEDLYPPSQKQIDLCLSAIAKARDNGFGVAVHCGAGFGRTGTVLGCYLVTQALSGKDAIARIRQLRPSSIETPEQEEAVEEFARRHRKLEDV